MITELCEMMTKYGSDKGQKRHDYTKYYFEIFKNIKDKKMNIFELGLGTNSKSFQFNMGPDGKPGASLRGWKEFFVNSKIYGADIDSTILFEEERIKTFYCDQTKKESIENLFNVDLKGIKFDVIIEDGLHKFYANEIFLRNSFKFLKEGGTYIIEDLTQSSADSFISIRESLISDLGIKEFEIIDRTFSRNKKDNRLLVLKK